MKLNLLTIVFCFCTITAYAQDFNTNYQPLICAYPENAAVLNEIKIRYKKDIQTLPSKNKSDYKEVYENRYNQLTDRFFNDNFFYDSRITTYFQNIFQEILDANPDIPNYELRLMISRSPIPNASSWGEGTITLNIGLIRRLENESQVAFVLCHELVHYMRNHSNLAIAKRIEMFNSRETKEEIKKIKNSEYNQNAMIADLMKDMMYDNSRHSRYNESEADSIALVYMKNTKYDLAESMTCMKILDEIDEDKYSQNSNLDYAKLLNTAGYPFKERWLKKEELMTFGEVKEEKTWNEDSLKTHPECSIRILNLNRQTQNLSQSGHSKFVQPETSFYQMVAMADFEMVEQAYVYGNLSRAIYYALQLLEKYPDNIYLNTVIARCFQQIYDVRMMHKAYNFVDLPANYYKDDYKQLLDIIQNLRSKEALEISYHLLEQHKDKFINDEYFLYVLVCSYYLKEKDAEFKTLKSEYLSTYPEGKYKAAIEAFSLTNDK